MKKKKNKWEKKKKFKVGGNGIMLRYNRIVWI